MASEMEWRIHTGEIAILKDIYGCEHYFGVKELEAAGWIRPIPPIPGSRNVVTALPKEPHG